MSADARRLFSQRETAQQQPAEVPADCCVYAVGDLHGRLDLLCEIEERILEDAAAREAARKVVVYLGDYVDRGPDSSGVLDHLTAAPLKNFESVYLMGNHEAMMLEFLRAGDVAALTWFMNGADETLASYGIDTAALRDAERPFEEMRRALLEALPATHRSFLDGLKRWHREGDYLFVHAGIRPGRTIEEQDPEDLIWIREPFLNNRDPLGCGVVHGHSPAPVPVERSNRIGLDTGAVYGGVLTAVALEGSARRFLEAG